MPPETLQTVGLLAAAAAVLYACRAARRAVDGFAGVRGLEGEGDEDHAWN